nr:hypothetical protein [Muricauda sp. UBA7809]
MTFPLDKSVDTFSSSSLVLIELIVSVFRPANEPNVPPNPL